MSAAGERTEAVGRRGFAAELGGFAAAGAGAYVADVGLFVLLRGPGGMDPLAAKSLSFLLGCTVAYLGNAFGPYRRRADGTGRLRRYTVFFLVNIAGACVQLACLALSHYGLGLTSARADVLSGAVIGMVLATALRFWGIRTLVFRREARGGRGE